MGWVYAGAIVNIVDSRARLRVDIGFHIGTIL